MAATSQPPSAFDYVGMWQYGDWLGNPSWEFLLGPTQLAVVDVTYDSDGYGQLVLEPSTMLDNTPDGDWCHVYIQTRQHSSLHVCWANLS